VMITRPHEIASRTNVPGSRKKSSCLTMRPDSGFLLGSVMGAPRTQRLRRGAAIGQEPGWFESSRSSWRSTLRFHARDPPAETALVLPQTSSSNARLTAVSPASHPGCRSCRRKQSRSG
jgi:hypothetical protein